jgi:hypothetical protein
MSPRYEGVRRYGRTEEKNIAVEARHAPVG